MKSSPSEKERVQKDFLLLGTTDMIQKARKRLGTSSGCLTTSSFQDSQGIPADWNSVIDPFPKFWRSPIKSSPCQEQPRKSASLVFPPEVIIVSLRTASKRHLGVECLALSTLDR